MVRVSVFSFWTLSRIYCKEFCSIHRHNTQYTSHFPLIRTISTQNIACANKDSLLLRNDNFCHKHEVIGFGCQSAPRNFSKYVSPSKSSFYFDTHMMVTDLTKCGFSLEQSEMITSAIADVVHSTVGSVKGNSVSRVEQEQLEIRLKSLIEKVRNDMIILEKTEFVRMKDECEKLKSEVASLKYLLQEEVVKLKSSQALDTSLERSRVKEEFQFRDQKIKDNNNRIDTEVARVETKIEAQKLDLLKYLVGSVLSLCTIILAFWRFFKM